MIRVKRVELSEIEASSAAAEGKTRALNLLWIIVVLTIIYSALMALFATYTRDTGSEANGRQDYTPVQEGSTNEDQSSSGSPELKSTEYPFITVTQYQYLLSELDSLGMLKSAQKSYLHEFLNQADPEYSNIALLISTFGEYKALVNELLSNRDITAGLKALLEAGDLQQAEVWGQTHYKTHYQSDDPTLAAHYFEKGQIHLLKRDFPQAVDAFAKANYLQPDNRLYMKKAGRAYFLIGAYDKARDLYTRALTQEVATFGEGHSELADTYYYLGIAWEVQGEYHKAIQYYEQSLSSQLQGFDKSLEGDLTQLAIVRNSLGKAWHHKGDYDQAVRYYEKALASAPPVAIASTALGYFSVAITSHNLGAAWQHKGHYDKAALYYEQALINDIQTFGEVHPNVAIRRHNLAEAWRERGAYDKAIGYYEQALDSDIRTFGQQHAKVAIRYNNLGMAWSNKGQYDKAIAYYEKALKIYSTALGNIHPKTRHVKRNILSAKNLKSKQSTT